MSKRILIVEDELPIAELEKDYLELSGFEVVICSDGTEGMKMATTEKFDNGDTGSYASGNGRF